MAIVNTPPGTPSSRKETHLTICTDPSRFQVEGSAPAAYGNGGAGFDGVRFIHSALPELSAEHLDTSVSFLGAKVALPFFISCMTGGSEGGFTANKRLAAAAAALRIPVGIGSIRVLISDAELFPHFNIKPLARDVPLLANIGAVQVRDLGVPAVMSVVQRLEAQALVVHLNPGQELFQPEGDRDFRGVKDAIRTLCDRSPVPVIVKETGFGIRPRLAGELLEAGAAYVDVAGAGGTNWVTVESYRLPEREKLIAAEFSDWGIPTALLLAATGAARGRILASGGLRTGMDAAKALALGAELAGFALPVIRAVVQGGTDAVVDLFRAMERSLKTVMLLTGCTTISELRTGTAIWYEPGFAAAVDSFTRAERSR
jgi:isopentenyl-diphosphate delta-isomerase type 2